MTPFYYHKKGKLKWVLTRYTHFKEKINFSFFLFLFFLCKILFTLLPCLDWVLGILTESVHTGTQYLPIDDRLIGFSVENGNFQVGSKVWELTGWVTTSPLVYIGDSIQRPKFYLLDCPSISVE